MYHPLAIELTEAQAKRALKGLAITIKPSQIGHGRLHVHAANKKKLEKAMKKDKSAIINLSFGELADTAQHHMENNGAGFWSRIWEGIKKGWSVLKQTGIPSAVVDVGVNALADYAGNPSLAAPARAQIKKITGVGLKGKKESKSEKKEKKEEKSTMKKSKSSDKLKALGLYLS